MGQHDIELTGQIFVGMKALMRYTTARLRL